MADQPKRSAFDPDSPKVKGGKSQDSSDKSTTPDHEKGLIDSIKGLIKQHSQAPGGTNTETGKQESTNEAVDRMSQAIKDVPGNSTDYG